MQSLATVKSKLLVLIAIAFPLFSTVLGCASHLSTNYLSGSQREEAIQEPAGVRTASAEEVAAPTSIPTEDNAPTADEALAAVLADLEEIEAIDRDAKDRLLVQLEGANPADYPLIVEAFRTALAYREQLAKREATDYADRSFADASQTSVDPQHATEPIDRPRPAGADMRSDRNAVQRQAKADLAEPPIAGSGSPAAAPSVSVVNAHPDGTADRSLQSNKRVMTLPRPPDRSADTPPGATFQQVAYDPVESRLVGWRTNLDETIAVLQQSLPPQPRNVDELHDHMRLRVLQLIADRDQEAYQPIPGASPDQQDYLSQQLFAIATFLNAEQHADEKDRAAAALLHLDEARGRLADLAALRIRNLAFVDAVDGYGAYEAAAEAKFRPGQAVTLYAEIENFRSQSTAEGFRTTLATSYQIVDSTGRRVDGAQFPEVEDVCRSRRRDFHMQYGIELPTRIYPDAYELQLIITDQQSNKIGQASIPLDIVE